MDNSPAPEAEYDEEATGMVRQALLDYLAQLPPAARAATDLYFRQVMPRVRVLATSA